MKRTSAAAAPAVLAAIMLLLALGGPALGVVEAQWRMPDCRRAVKAVAFSESKAVSAFLWASIGAGLSALLVPPVPLQALPTRKVMPSRNLSIVVAVVSAVTFVAYVVGEGPSFLRNEVYLHTTVLCSCCCASLPLGFVCGMHGNCADCMGEGPQKLRLFLIATAALWFIATSVYR